MMHGVTGNSQFGGGGGTFNGPLFKDVRAKIFQQFFFLRLLPL